MEKKACYQPATVIFLKTVLLTFFMKNKWINLAEPIANELISMIEVYNKWHLDHLFGYIFCNYARVGEA